MSGGAALSEASIYPWHAQTWLLSHCVTAGIQEMCAQELAQHKELEDPRHKQLVDESSGIAFG